MAISTVSLGKVKFNWRGVWSSSQNYVKDDVVKYGPNVYTCINAHTSQAAFASNDSDWDLMVAGLENAGTWNTSTLYQIGQTVTYGGAVYIALQESTNLNPYTNSAYWQRFVDGQQFEGDWDNAVNYQKGDIVRYGGYSYVAKQNTLAYNPIDTVYWDIYIRGYADAGNFDPAIQYKPGDVVAFGANKYVVKEGIRPLGDLPTNTSSYDLLISSFEYKGIYNDITEYRPGEVVTFGGRTYSNVTAGTGQQPTASPNWSQLSDGFTYRGIWNSSTVYKPGEMVRFGANTYFATSITEDNAPDVNSAFTLLNQGFRYIGTWDSNENYILGDVIRFSGRTFICVESHDNDGSTLTEPPNSDYWDLLVEGMSWTGVYAAGTEYEYGSVVEYQQSSYICIANDAIGITPGTDPLVWNIVAQGDISSPMTTEGDIIYRNGTGNIERLPIGADGSFLISNNGIPSWGTQTPQQDFYISPQGDDTNDGRTATTSWRTIKHACEQTFNYGQCRINIMSGVYEEQTPIKVGRSVVVEGNGLGAVTVSPNNDRDEGFGIGISDDGSTPNANSELFHMNNGARLRNFTFRGFSTGSVIVSLDPGTGPDDTSVWITSQSPYVQNCTSFTPGGTGFKIDGGLHNGGYKSMVANDWTQINSDGIGIHALNDGRTEIVSCFTYYCDIGYLAESGAKIRAIVGNNSYGEYGAVARGYSESEDPLRGKLRLNDETLESIIQLNSDIHVFTSYRDSVGNRFFVGHTDPTGTDVSSTFDNAASYPVAIKYNSAGSLDWIYTYEGKFGAIHSAVELADRIYCGGVVVDGGTTKGFILALSKAGEIQWDKTIANTTSIEQVTTDGDNLYAVGQHVDTGVAVVSTNPAGIERWATTLEYNDSSVSNSLTATAVCCAGAPTTSVDTYALAGDATAEKNLYIAAFDNVVNQTTITRITNLGEYVTTYQYGDVRINSLNIDTGNGDGIYLVAAGYYDPAGAVTKTPLMMRLTVTGVVQWQNQLVSANENGEWSDVLPFGDDIYVSGYINEGTNNNSTGIIARFNSLGEDDWIYKIDNGTNNIAFNGVMLDGINVIAAGIENQNSVITNVQRDTINEIGTVSSGSYTFTALAGITLEDNTVVTQQFNEIASTNISLGSTDSNLNLNQSPTQTRTVVATRSGFAGIGTGVQFSIDSLDRPPKEGSVLQIDGDDETYFVIGVANYLGPNLTYSNNQDAQAIVTANKQFLIDEVIDYLASAFPSLTYNEATCRRDLGLIVDAFIVDLDTNTNANSIDAAYEYYSNASGLYAITEQKAETVAAINYLRDIVDDVILQNPLGFTYSSTPQVTGLTAAETGADTLTVSNAQAISDILNGGLSNGPSKINYGTAIISIDPAIPSNKTPNDITHITMREAFSQVRMSGHDFLDIGTGGFADTNYPVIIASDYVQQPSQDREVLSEQGGRVFYVTTDQDGNFRVGDYFKVEQATGRATLSSEEFDLAGLNELQLGSITAGKQGATINEFSTDGTFADNSDTSVPTERATKTYVDQEIDRLQESANKITAGNAPVQSKIEVTGSGSNTDTIDLFIAGNEIVTVDENGLIVLQSTNTVFSVNDTTLDFAPGGTSCLTANATTLQVKPSGTLSFEAGDQYVLIPVGSELQRPGSPNAGYLRFNSDTGTFEGYDGTQWTGIGGGNPWETITSNKTASANDRYFVDTSSNAIIVNLPAAPNAGDIIRFLDLEGTFETNTLTLNPGLLNINATNDTLIVDTNNAGLAVVYTNATQGWKILEL
mgnify:FL=1